jgi:RNA recognition motif-containing protein
MNIYVGNVSYSATEEQLRELFSQYGTVKSVKIILDKFTGQPRGFAFVVMGSEEEADAAIAGLDGKEVAGRNLRINKAREREEGQGGQGSQGGRPQRSERPERSGGFSGGPRRTPRY